MNSSNSLRRFQGHVSRLLGLVPHSTSAAVGDAGLVTAAPLTSLPSAPYLFTRRTRTFTSAAAYRVDAPVKDHEEFKVITFDTSEEFDEPAELTLPSDIRDIQKLNPELAEAMEAHAEFARKSTSGMRESLEPLVTQANKGKATNITKTSLSRLRIDQLRSVLDDFGGDPRGNKAALVQRILDLVKSADDAAATSTAAEALGEGIVSRKQLERAARLRAREGVSHADVGMSEAELRSTQQEIVNSGSDFTRAFATPHEVAQLLVAARADDIMIIDVRGQCTFTDYMVLASGRSSQLVHMMAAGVLHELKQRCKEVAPGVSPCIEGVEDPNPEWLVVDAGSVVVHIFAEDARKKFDLEGLWTQKDNVVRVAPKADAINTINTLRV